MAQDCIFCKIISNEIPSKKIHEDSNTIAILDINPASLGHTLVISKRHFPDIYSIDDSALGDVMKTVKVIADRLKSKLNAEGVNILQNNGRNAGQLVDHIHFHVIPRYTHDGISFNLARAQISEEQMKELHDKLRDNEPKPPGRALIGPGW